MVFPDQLDMTSFRILLNVAMAHKGIEISRDLSAKLAVHKVANINPEGMVFSVHTDKGFHEYWMTMAEVALINTHYPNVGNAEAVEDPETHVIVLSPHGHNAKTKFTLYPITLPEAEENEDE